MLSPYSNEACTCGKHEHTMNKRIINKLKGKGYRRIHVYTFLITIQPEALDLSVGGDHHRDNQLKSTKEL